MPNGSFEDMREAIRVAAEVERFRAGWERLWGAERAAELATEAERRARTLPLARLEACRQVGEEEILRLMREAPTGSVQVWACGVAPCPCECNRGEFCGGCGHAGCGRRHQ